MIPLTLAGTFTVFVAAFGVVYAQPSPEVQRRISAAIEAAGNTPIIDYADFVNPFIGTGMRFPPTNENPQFDLKYMELLSDNFGDVWFVSVRRKSSVCLTHPLSAQPRSICPLWHVMLYSITPPGRCLKRKNR